jgi:hypothetical protein
MLKLGVIKVAKQSSQSPFWGCSYLVSHYDGFQRLPRFPFWSGKKTSDGYSRRCVDVTGKVV